jgi:methionyl-tRNA formyltransferase
MKIIFIGTPEFGAIILEGLIKANFEPVLVITTPDKPVGRKQIITPPPVKLLAEKYEIPILQPEKLQVISYKLQEIKPDLIIVAAYGQIIPRDILDIPKYGCLNIHPSLLPKHRGASPIQYAILNGDKKTGVTIMLMDEKMDHGPILAKREWEIPNPKSQITNKSQILNSKITYEELHNKLADLGAKLLIETIPKWINKEIKPTSQDDSRATYTKIIKKEDGKIDWKKPAEEIERKIRAFDPWPGAFTRFKIKDLRFTTFKILKADVLEQTKNGPFGEPGKTFLAPDDKIAVQTGKDFLIIEKLQQEGKKPMTSEEFLRGHLDFIGKILI